MICSRTGKSVLNAQVNLLSYVAITILGFFSRKVFLDYLGADFVGLTGTLGTIIGFLNLAEFGISAAIAFALYKPLQQDDHDKIGEIVSILGVLYCRIGAFISIAGLLVSCFLPLFFEKTQFSNFLLLACFYSFLFSALIGYFFNYKQLLLSADQRNYVVVAYFQLSRILKTLVQMYVAWRYQNLYAWALIELLFSVWCSWILNYQIRKTYPWLRASLKEGKRLLSKYPDIIKRTKQVFVHRLKDFILTQSDQILIFAFVSLSMVAYYGNYTLIIGSLSTIFMTTLQGMGASVGNLVSEGNRANIKGVFWQLLALYYFIAGIVLYTAWNYVAPVIILWLGEKYVLDPTILFLLLCVFYVSLTRGVVDMYNGAYANWGDTWSAWTEGFINLTASLICGYLWGIVGLLIGKLASLVPIILIWKPYYLYSQGFKEKVGEYWVAIGKYAVCFTLAVGIAYACRSGLSVWLPAPDECFLALCLTGCTDGAVFVAIYAGLLYASTKGFRDLTARAVGIVKSKLLHS